MQNYQLQNNHNLHFLKISNFTHLQNAIHNKNISS